MVAVLVGGCSLGRKSWGMAGSADAFKIVFVDPAASGGVAPELIAGGGCFASVFALPYSPGDNYPTMISFSRRKSMWGVFNSSDSGNMALVYVAGTKESPADTVAILTALKKVIDNEK